MKGYTTQRISVIESIVMDTIVWECGWSESIEIYSVFTVVLVVQLALGAAPNASLQNPLSTQVSARSSHHPFYPFYL